MPHPHQTRATDTLALSDIIGSGFIIRKRTPGQQIFYFFAALIIVVAGVSLLVYYDTLTGCFLSAGVGLILLFPAFKLNEWAKNQRADEFMNALFANALNKGYQFTMILRRDGKIIYLNRAFQQIFPAFLDQRGRDIKTLCSLYRISDDYYQTISTHITDGTQAIVAVIVHYSDDKAPQPLVLTIEPIEHPMGFVLIRGK